MAELTKAEQPVSAAKPAFQYRYNPRQKYKYPDAVTLVPVFDLTKKPGPNDEVVSVALGDKEIRRTLAATKDRPELEMVSKVATQAQLKYLFEVEQHPHIERFVP